MGVKKGVNSGFLSSAIRYQEKHHYSSPSHKSIKESLVCKYSLRKLFLWTHYVCIFIKLCMYYVSEDKRRIVTFQTSWGKWVHPEPAEAAAAQYSSQANSAGFTTGQCHYMEKRNKNVRFLMKIQIEINANFLTKQLLQECNLG